MLTFKCYLRVLYKHSGMVITYFCIFMALVICFTSVGKRQEESTFSAEKTVVAVIDGDKSALSEALISALKERQDYVELEDESDEAIRDALYNAEVAYVLWVPMGYFDALMKGMAPLLKSADASGAYYADYIDSFVGQFVASAEAYAAAGFTAADIVRLTVRDTNQTGEVTMLKDGGAQNVLIGGVSPIYCYYAYMTYGLMCIIMFGLSTVLMAFYSTPVELRLNCTPERPSARIAFMALASLVFSAIIYALMALFGVIMYQREFFTQESALCLLNGLCFMAVALGMAFLVAQFCADDPNKRVAVINTLSLSICFLGGIFVPMDIMNDTVKQIANFTPTYWYMVVLDALYASRSVPNYDQIWQAMGIELLFGAAFMALAMALTARRRVH